MHSRFLSIKKSSWLSLSLVVNSMLFIGASLSFCLLLKNYDLWFFAFCFFVGLHLIFKSYLFKFDSSCYFGVLLLLLGALYFLSLYFNITNFYPVFVLTSFTFASFFTFAFFRQSFHLYLAISLFFVTIGILLYQINLISLWIFLAIILLSMILLVVRYFSLNRSK